MTPESLAVFLACSFAAEVIGTIAGFGAATVLTPIASWFFPIKTAVALVACFHLFGNASRLSFFGRHIDWRIAVRFGLIGVACSFLGAWLSLWLSPSLMRLLLGGFLVLYATLGRLPSGSRSSLAEGVVAVSATTVRVPARTSTLVTGGALSGLIAGVIGTGGAVRSMCLLAFGLPKEAYLGTSAVIALVVDATRVPVYLSQGLLPRDLWLILAALTVVAFAGAWLGQRLVRIIPAARFKQFVLVLLLLMGAKLLWDGWRGMAP